MTTTPNQPVTPVRDLAALVASVPTLLGFQPHRSVVAVFIGSSRRVALTMRVDIHEARKPSMVSTTLLAADRADADEVILVGYTQRPGPVVAELLRDVAIAIEHEAMDAEQPVTVRHMAMVGAEHWCQVPPWSGDALAERPVSELSEHPVVAQRIYDGVAIETSREALGRRIEPGTEAVPEGFATGYAEASEHMRGLAGHESAELVAAILDDAEMREQGTYPDGEALGWLVAAIRDGEARDQASTRITRETALRWVEFWSYVSRMSEGQASVVPLALVGLASWVRGDGAMAGIAAERASAIDPNNALARLVASCNENCLPPEMWEALLDTFHRLSAEGEDEQDVPEDAYETHRQVTS